MQIIEQKIEGKLGDPARCEDGLFVGEHFIAVVDGTTNKEHLGPSDKPGGLLAREAICALLADLAPDVTCFDAVAQITACRAALGGQHKATPRAVAIIYSRHRKEIWSIGDCQCLINGVRYAEEKAIDGVLSACRSAVIEMLLAAGETEASLMQEDKARAQILPMLERQHLLENTVGRYGYPVLNGQPIPREYIKCYKVTQGAEVVLASDGYPVLCHTLAESEAALAKLKKSDPLCYKQYVSTKGFRADGGSFDDRTYVRFIV